MNDNYERVIEVDELPRATERPELLRFRGYAAHLGEQWFWFPALAPAYAFTRAAGMSPDVPNRAEWEARRVEEAVREIAFRADLGREVRTLYTATAVSLVVDYSKDKKLLAEFVDGARGTSGYWPSNA